MGNEEIIRLENKLKELSYQKKRAETQLEVLEVQSAGLRSEIKKLELTILLTPPSGSAETYHGATVRQLQTLHAYKSSLQENDRLKSSLERRLRAITVRHVECAYWLNQGLYGDASRRQEALKHVFEN